GLQQQSLGPYIPCETMVSIALSTYPDDFIQFKTINKVALNDLPFVPPVKRNGIKDLMTPNTFTDTS
ncbi:hypothetical protein SARC_14820, partial [Sphaeroforma arctica JP610]